MPTPEQLPQNPNLPELQTSIFQSDRFLGSTIFTLGLLLSAVGMFGANQLQETQTALEQTCQTDARTAQLEDMPYDEEACLAEADRGARTNAAYGVTGLGVLAMTGGVIILARREQ